MYRHPRVGDRTLDRVLYSVGTAASLLGAILSPPPWSYVLFALAAVLALGSLLQLRRRYAEAEDPMWTRRRTQLEHQALIDENFATQPESYTVSCRYCGWSTDDYAHRLVLAPAHLHDHHPQFDTRIPNWLRRRWTSWLGKRITYG